MTALLLYKSTNVFTTDRLFGHLDLFLANNTLSRLREETDNFLYLLAVGNLLAHLVDSVEQARLSVKDKSIGIANMLYHLIVDSIKLTHHLVYTAILTIVVDDDIRRNIA